MEKLLCSDLLRSYIIENDILVWVGNVAELEAYTVSKSLGVNRFPFMGLIVYDTSHDERPKMSCISKLEGLPDAVEFLAFLQQSLESFGPTLISLRADRQEHSFAREIRAEQDSAYEISLRKDRERVERERKELEEEQQRAAETTRKLEQRASWRRWQKSRISQEPQATTGVSKISFRLPNGSRIVRKFTPNTQLIELYNWVDLQLYHDADQGDVLKEGTAVEPTDYTHEYNFTLATPLPRQVLEPSDRELSVVKAIYPSGSVVVEEIV